MPPAARLGAWCADAEGASNAPGNRYRQNGSAFPDEATTGEVLDAAHLGSGQVGDATAGLIPG